MFNEYSISITKAVHKEEKRDYIPSFRAQMYLNQNKLAFKLWP